MACSFGDYFEIDDQAATGFTMLEVGMRVEIGTARDEVGELVLKLRAEDGFVTFVHNHFISTESISSCRCKLFR